MPRLREPSIGKRRLGQCYHVRFGPKTEALLRQVAEDGEIYIVELIRNIVGMWAIGHKAKQIKQQEEETK